jgi:hypothetical protein
MLSLILMPYCATPLCPGLITKVLFDKEKCFSCLILSIILMSYWAKLTPLCPSLITKVPFGKRECF